MPVSGSEQSLPVRDLRARSSMIDVRESSIKQRRTSRLITQEVQVNKRGENKENKAKKYLILKPIFTCCHNQNWTKNGDPSRKFVNRHKIWRSGADTGFHSGGCEILKREKIFKKGKIFYIVLENNKK